MRYDSWEEIGSLPPYNAVLARVNSKTGDMKLSLGGTPPSARYKGKREYNNGELLESRLSRLARNFSREQQPDPNPASG